MDQEEYLKDLKRRQDEHLKNVSNSKKIHWQPCLHDECGSCHGTGVKIDGSACVHFISCPCPKCSPYCLMYDAKLTNIYNTILSKAFSQFRHTNIVGLEDVESIFKPYLEG